MAKVTRLGGFKDNVETLTDSTYNGKPLYRRVIKASTPANMGSIYSFTGQNIEECFIDEGHSYHLLTNGNRLPINYAVSGQDDFCRVWCNSTGVFVHYGEGIANTKKTMVITIEYTKITD